MTISVSIAKKRGKPGTAFEKAGLGVLRHADGHVS